ncbi:hypothetical protein [Lysinibacillus sp. LZ02]|uniref:hypothetical protein n=1 Tax=Lysinibacillus sp. LZ02 TaxID=3420668 RepID=UPI003D3697E2
MSKNNNKKVHQDYKEILQSNENTSAKLAVIGGIITTLGDAILTMAAVIALEELETQNQNSNVSLDKLTELEKQVHFLTKEINKLKYPHK